MQNKKFKHFMIASIINATILYLILFGVSLFLSEEKAPPIFMFKVIVMILNAYGVQLCGVESVLFYYMLDIIFFSLISIFVYFVLRQHLPNFSKLIIANIVSFYLIKAVLLILV